MAEYIPTTSYSLGASTKKPGWHSRRNETDMAQRKARAHFETSRGPKNRVETAKERDEARKMRSTQDQLDLIESRRKAGKGESKKEKVRLLSLLEKEKNFVMTPEMNALAKTQADSVNPSLPKKKHYQREKRS
jgi:hypothetical protein